MKKYENKIIEGDCIELFKNIKEPFADLIFADPPFNIGYQYDKYEDNLKKDKYLSWTNDWITACLKILKPNGSFFIAIGDDYAAEVKQIAEQSDNGKQRLYLRNWIIWHYTFGQQTKNKFARSHTHVFYFVKDPDNFNFYGDHARVFSDRQTIYNDKRANSNGKMPDDVWNEYPRICGTFEEREEWHPCQMPESLLARIIRVSTEPEDWVVDPFSGSGTTLVVAHKLKRIYTGIDISPKYVEETRKRIIELGELPVEGESPPKWHTHFDSELKWLYHENKVHTEKLVESRELLTLFTNKFNFRIGTQFQPDDIKHRLKYLRKSAKLGPLKR